MEATIEKTKEATTEIEATSTEELTEDKTVNPVEELPSIREMSKAEIVQKYLAKDEPFTRIKRLKLVEKTLKTISHRKISDYSSEDLLVISLLKKFEEEQNPPISEDSE